MFESHAGCRNIKVMLNTDYRKLKIYISYTEVIYSGQWTRIFDSLLRQTAPIARYNFGLKR